MRGVLVDTSVFINFFRDKSASALQDLVAADLVLLSHYVRLEILAGISKDSFMTLHGILESLHSIPFQAEHREVAEKFLLKLKAKGINAGLVDILLAAEAAVHGIPIYSFDKVFEQFEKKGLVQLFRPENNL